MEASERASNWQILRRGIAMSPSMTKGLWLTIVLTVMSAAGATVIPLVIGRVLDEGFGANGTAAVWRIIALTTVLMVVVVIAGYFSKLRIWIAAERGLLELRVRAFRHVHDLSMLTQNTHSRGSLVSRVTSDVDQISLFLQSAGMIMIVSLGQMLVALIAMFVLSWQLALITVAVVAPWLACLKLFSAAMSRAYDRVRASVGTLLATIAEPIAGAEIVRAHGLAERTGVRIDASVNGNYRANVKAQTVTAFTFASAILVGGLANAVVLGLGVVLGVSGSLSSGTIIAFIFMVGLLTGPMQMATQVIAEAQNAISSWRRVIELLDTPADVTDPEPATDLPPGPIEVRCDHVMFGYRPERRVLDDVCVTIAPQTRVAVVGQTGSGKTTFAKLVTRLMDTTGGVVCLQGVPIDQVSFEQLRRRVVMVPQEGFLFNDTLRANLRYGNTSADDAAMLAVIADLELDDWFATLPSGLDTAVGARGEQLSAGERQLVALVRAALADPDLIVLDEATSSVDPRTELRTSRALAALLQGRTSITIAHRLSTAETSDRVLVFDEGRLVEDGSHRDLVAAQGIYARLHATWIAQTQTRSQSPLLVGPERMDV